MHILLYYITLFFRCPMYTFHQVLMDNHADVGTSLQDVFPYHKFRFAWNSFIRLLDVDLTTGFSCPSCPPDGPDIIICDGTSLSFQRRMWKFDAIEVKSSQIPCQTRYVKLIY